jgi:peptide/nickel transport system permease protein
MLSFVVRRLLVAIPILLVASMLVFTLVVNAGDPLENLRTQRNAQQLMAQKTEQLHLNRSLPVRYGLWVKGFVTGDLGKNAVGVDVRPVLLRAMRTTLRLVLAAVLLSMLLGLTVGVISAVRQYSGFDYGATFIAFLFFAMPVFWFAVLLKEFGAIRLNNWLQRPSLSWLGVTVVALVVASIAVFAASIGERRSRRRSWTGFGIGAVAGTLIALGVRSFLHGRHFARWVSTVGPETPGFKGSFAARLGDYAGHMILPTVTLAAISFATYSRYQRASMLDTLSSDYVRTARAKGITERRVILRHAFRTALIPVATLAALDFAFVMAGAIITESVFAWKGMGSLFLTGLKDVDPNTVMGFLMVTAIMVVVFNIIADIAYAYLDPRIRLD